MRRFSKHTLSSKDQAFNVLCVVSLFASAFLVWSFLFLSLFVVLFLLNFLGHLLLFWVCLDNQHHDFVFAILLVLLWKLNAFVYVLHEPLPTIGVDEGGGGCYCSWSLPYTMLKGSEHFPVIRTSSGCL